VRLCCLDSMIVLHNFFRSINESKYLVNDDNKLLNKHMRNNANTFLGFRLLFQTIILILFFKEKESLVDFKNDIAYCHHFLSILIH